MTVLLECVPNVSEGRDAEAVRRMAAAFTSAGGTLLDTSSDADHNRSVITFAGTPDEVVEGAVRGARAALERIDLNRHTGEHPRMGAADVIPFVPLGTATMNDAVAAAEKAADRIAREVGVPTFLYGDAARRPEDTAGPRREQTEGSAPPADHESVPRSRPLHRNERPTDGFPSAAAPKPRRPGMLSAVISDTLSAAKPTVAPACSSRNGTWCTISPVVA